MNMALFFKNPNRFYLAAFQKAETETGCLLPSHVGIPFQRRFASFFLADCYLVLHLENPHAFHWPLKCFLYYVSNRWLKEKHI